MTAEQNILIDALCVAVTGKSRQITPQADWPTLLQLGQIHGLLPLLCDGLQKTPEVWAQIPKQIQDSLFGFYMQAIYKETQQTYTCQQLTQLLTDAQIPHVLLKGAVLRHSYPVPALRTMSDLDILVYAKDFDGIDRVAKQLGGKSLPGDGNHRNYTFPGKVGVEFHPNLLHHATPIGTDINPGWQYTKASDAYTRELTAEGFYLNTICHLANHFVQGGIGVRFVLDVWVNRHLHQPEMDRAFVEAELERFGLLDFTRNIEDLADAWFGDGVMTPVLEEMGQYILYSGSHGTTDQAMLNSLSLSPGGSRLGALWKKVFYPRAELEDRFPWCKGKLLLLPAAWCCRAYNAITINGKLVAQWSKETGSYSKEQVAENREMLRRFGISKDHKGGRL